jgi:DNA modification methylase
VFGPLSFLSATMSLCARALRPGGIVIVFTDWRRLPDMGYIASTVGLRPATCVAWVRNRPGTGGLQVHALLADQVIFAVGAEGAAVM